LKAANCRIVETPFKGDSASSLLLLKFTGNPRELQKQAILRIGRYIMPNKGERIIFRPENGQDMELSCEADFCGNQRTETTHVDNPTSRASKMQTEVALITTRAELFAISKGY